MVKLNERKMRWIIQEKLRGRGRRTSLDPTSLQRTRESNNQRKFE